MTERERFKYRLALALGYANPDAMLARMPYRVWRGWLLYAQYEPFGEARGDLRQGLIRHTMISLWSKKRARLKQLIPKFGPREKPKPKTPDQLFSKLTAMTQRMGGKIIDKRKKPDGG